MISVTRERFYEIFENAKYVKVEVHREGCFSFCEYNIRDSDTNNIVGYCTDTSYENTYKVIKELCSDSDLICHYEREIKWLKCQNEWYKEESLRRAKYKNLPLWGKIVHHYKKWRGKHNREGKGLFEFMESDNVVACPSPTFNTELITSALKEIWEDE